MAKKKTEFQEQMAATQPSADDLIKRHNEINEFVKAEGKKFSEYCKPFNAEMEQIENQLLALFQAQGVEKLSTEHGTAYTSTLMTPKVENFDVALDWAMENWNVLGMDMVQVRPKVEALRTYMDNNGGKLPPGISVSYFTRLNIRRS
jgi:hypothetical protein